MRWLWAGIGLLTLALGMVGAFLPILPTVPFLLLSAFCFARSSERLYNWLLSHPLFGPPIQDWRRNGAIRRRAKFLATASIAAAFIVPFALKVAPAVLTFQAFVLAAVLFFIWSRPEA